MGGRRNVSQIVLRAICTIIIEDENALINWNSVARDLVKPVHALKIRKVLEKLDYEDAVFQTLQICESSLESGGAFRSKLITTFRDHKLISIAESLLELKWDDNNNDDGTPSETTEDLAVGPGRRSVETLQEDQSGQPAVADLVSVLEPDGDSSENSHFLGSAAESENAENQTPPIPKKRQSPVTMVFQCLLAVSVVVALLWVGPDILHSMLPGQERNDSIPPTENPTTHKMKVEYPDRVTVPDLISTSTQKSHETEQYASRKTRLSVPASTQLEQATVDFSSYLHHYPCNKIQTLNLILDGVNDHRWLPSYLKYCDRQSIKNLTISGPITNYSLGVILSSNLSYSLESLNFNDTSCDGLDFYCPSIYANLSKEFQHLSFNNTRGGCGYLYKYLRLCINMDAFELSYSNSQILDWASGSELCELERESGHLMLLTNTTGVSDCIKAKRVD